MLSTFPALPYPPSVELLPEHFLQLSTPPTFPTHQPHTVCQGCHSDLYLKCGFVVLCGVQLTSPPVNDTAIFHLHPNMDHEGIKINNGAVKRGLGFAVWQRPTCTPELPPTFTAVSLGSLIVPGSRLSSVPSFYPATATSLSCTHKPSCPSVLLVRTAG